MLQDLAKSKPKKRKECVDDKVAQTEKALAKARAERGSVKKSKIDLSVEVNNPRVGSGVGETNISLHSSDFRPRGSPGYTHDLPLLLGQ